MMMTSCIWKLFIASIVCASIINSSSSPTAACAATTGAPVLGNLNSLHLCYFYFGGIDDFGWTFSYNNGRMAAHQLLQAKYPNVTITSRYQQNTALIEDKRENFLVHVRKGCRVVLTNSRGLLGSDDWAAANYPNISFILLDDDWAIDPNHYTAYPNRLYVSMLFASAYYAAGVAAARVTTTGRIGFVSAWEVARNSNDATNGFLLGVRDQNSSIEVDLVTMNSWYSPDAEAEVAELLLDMGCDVIGRYTDAQFIDNVVRERNDALSGGSDSVNPRQLYSIGPHTRLQEYVGDSILIAIYQEWEYILVPLLSEVMEEGNANQSNVPNVLGFRETVRLSPLSTRAQEHHQQDLDTLADNLTDEVFCGSHLVTIQGNLVVTAETNTSSGCRVASIPLTEYIDVSQRNHGVFDNSSACPAGSSFKFVVDPLIVLECTACPVDTYSDHPGTAECVPCLEGTTTNGGISSTVCMKIIPPLNMPLVVVSALAGLLVIIIAILVAFARVSSVRNQHAVRKPPMAIIFTDVESSTKLWGDHPKAMAKAILLHHQIIRGVLQTHKVYEVKTIGDSFMIAAKTMLEATLVAMDIQTALSDCIDWPAEFKSLDEGGHLSGCWNGLLVRIGIHWCTDCTARWERLHQSYDYYGNDVNIAARISGKAYGGQIVFSRETLSKLKEDSLYPLMVERDSRLSFLQDGVQLRGIENKTFSMYSITPLDLQARTFPAIQVDALSASGFGASSGSSALTSLNLASMGMAKIPIDPRPPPSMNTSHLVDDDAQRQSGSFYKGGGSGGDSTQNPLFGLEEITSSAQPSGSGGPSRSKSHSNNLSLPREPRGSQRSSTQDIVSVVNLADDRHKHRTTDAEKDGDTSTIASWNNDIPFSAVEPDVVLAKQFLRALLTRPLHPSNEAASERARQERLFHTLLSYHGLDINLGYARCMGYLSLNIHRRLKYGGTPLTIGGGGEEEAPGGGEGMKVENASNSSEGDDESSYAKAMSKREAWGQQVERAVVIATNREGATNITF